MANRTTGRRAPVTTVAPETVQAPPVETPAVSTEASKPAKVAKTIAETIADRYNGEVSPKQQGFVDWIHQESGGEFSLDPKTVKTTLTLYQTYQKTDFCKAIPVGTGKAKVEKAMPTTPEEAKAELEKARKRAQRRAEQESREAARNAKLEAMLKEAGIEFESPQSETKAEVTSDEDIAEGF